MLYIHEPLRCQCGFIVYSTAIKNMILEFRERKMNMNYSNLRSDVLFSH